MNLQRELRNHLRLYVSREVRNEPACTCGAADHARVFAFRVKGEPVTVVVPEAYEPSESALSLALDGLQVERLSPADLDSIFPETELGQTDPFENPFTTTVYLDDSLLQFRTLVFCPKMFNAQIGKCFRVPTRTFRELTRPVVVRLSPLDQPGSELD